MSLISGTNNMGSDGKPADDANNPLAMVRSNKQTDLGKVRDNLQQCSVHASRYFDRYNKNFNVINCLWSNQSDDQRKHNNTNAKAFPYDGAADTKVPLIADGTRFMRELFKGSLGRMRVQAIPLTNNDQDVRKSSEASYLLKYIQNNIPNWAETMDYCASQFWELTGVAAAKVEYCKERRLIRKKYRMDQLAPEIQQAISDPKNDEQLAINLGQIFDEMTPNQIMGCLAELRDNGECEVNEEIPVREGVRVVPKSLAEDLIIPPSTIDIQDLPYLHEIFLLTPEQLLQRAQDEGWDETWAENVVSKYVGVDSVQSFLAGEKLISEKTTKEERMDGLIQLVCSWEKRIDSDGAIGIYKTIWHPGNLDEAGIFELSDAEDGLYPFILKKRENSSKRIMDSKTLTEQLEGYQFIYKECVDNASNRESIATFPPYEIRVNGDFDGNNDTDIGPGTPFRTHGVGAFEWKAPPIGGEQMNIEVRREIRFLMDQFIGRPSDGIVPEEAKNKIQGEMSGMADFVTQVMQMAYTKFKQYGPNEATFKITGVNQIIKVKNDPSDSYQVVITLATESLDDTVKKLEAVGALMAYDKTNKINNAKFIEKSVQRIDMELADQLVEGDDASYQRSIEEERSAINSITSGQNVDIPPKEAFNPTKAQYLAQYIQSPAGQAQMKNPYVAPLLQKRMEQWQMKSTQQENAQIGRLGTEPGNAGQQ